MQRITKRLLSITLLFVAVILLASCATGLKFQKADKIPEGMGLVYIYRIHSVGTLVIPEVEANGVGITKLITNGYYAYFSKPGDVEFSAKTETKSSVTLYIKAGQTYYIRGRIVTGAFIGRPLLTLVSPKVGENEIADCKLQEGRQPALDEKMNKTDTSAITPEEILLLKKAGMSDEKILEMQKKGERLPLPKINPFDWNEDGKKDIIAGSDSGQVYVYLNKGTNQESVFDAAIEIPNVKVEDGKSAPYVVDWNDDGKKDIITGSGPGEVSIFRNKGTNKEPSFAEEQKINGGDLDVGDYSSPAMVDWDGDGLKDLVVGGKNGKVFLFLNVGYE
ncbi:MAG: VCBS repeat-containing protein, partial [Nitrospirae bacterium]|nr:VCBS repeat-containing protein [Nitrospirota bacterium]